MAETPEHTARYIIFIRDKVEKSEKCAKKAQKRRRENIVLLTDLSKVDLLSKTAKLGRKSARYGLSERLRSGSAMLHDDADIRVRRKVKVFCHTGAPVFQSLPYSASRHITSSSQPCLLQIIA